MVDDVAAAAAGSESIEEVEENIEEAVLAARRRFEEGEGIGTQAAEFLLRAGVDPLRLLAASPARIGSCERQTVVHGEAASIAPAEDMCVSPPRPCGSRMSVGLVGSERLPAAKSPGEAAMASAGVCMSVGTSAGTHGVDEHAHAEHSVGGGGSECLPCPDELAHAGFGGAARTAECGSSSDATVSEAMMSRAEGEGAAGSSSSSGGGKRRGKHKKAGTLRAYERTMASGDD